MSFLESIWWLFTRIGLVICSILLVIVGLMALFGLSIIAGKEVWEVTHNNWATLITAVIVFFAELGAVGYFVEDIRKGW